MVTTLFSVPSAIGMFFVLATVEAGDGHYWKAILCAAVAVFFLHRCASEEAEEEEEEEGER